MTIINGVVITVPKDRDEVYCEYCNHEYDIESPYIRYIYKKYKNDKVRGNSIITVVICRDCVWTLCQRGDLTRIRSDLLKLPSNTIRYEFTNYRLV